jgi:hypothetical protein
MANLKYYFFGLNYRLHKAAVEPIWVKTPPRHQSRLCRAIPADRVALYTAMRSLAIKHDLKSPTFPATRLYSESW